MLAYQATERNYSGKYIKNRPDKFNFGSRNRNRPLNININGSIRMNNSDENEASKNPKFNTFSAIEGSLINNLK